MLVYRNCGVIVAKFKFELLSVDPSTRGCCFHNFHPIRDKVTSICSVFQFNHSVNPILMNYPGILFAQCNGIKMEMRLLLMVRNSLLV
jgi:hypothetical protein